MVSGHTANIQQIYGRWLLDIQQTYGGQWTYSKHMANIRQTCAKNGCGHMANAKHTPLWYFGFTTNIRWIYGKHICQYNISVSPIHTHTFYFFISCIFRSTVPPFPYPWCQLPHLFIPCQYIYWLLYSLITIKSRSDNNSPLGEHRSRSRSLLCPWCWTCYTWSCRTLSHLPSTSTW